MSIFKRLKDKTKNLLFGSNKIGDFVDNTTQNFKKLRNTVPVSQPVGRVTKGITATAKPAPLTPRPAPIAAKPSLFKQVVAGDTTSTLKNYPRAVVDTAWSGLKSVGKMIIASEQGVANQLGTIGALHSQDYKDAITSIAGADEMNMKLAKKIQENKKAGKDTTRLVGALLSNYTLKTDNNILPELDRTTLQQVADWAGVGLDIITAGGGLSLLKKTAGKEVVKQSGKALVKEGVALGAGYGATGYLQDTKDPTLKGAALATAGGALVGGALAKGGQVLGRVSRNLAEKSAAKTKVAAEATDAVIGRITKEKANILKEPSQRLTEFLKSEGKYLQEEAGKRTEAISSFTNTNPAEIVKIRRAGNGTIKITKGELETMKKAGDLKPAPLERYFQNPIRVFEELGEPVKELFYRPVKAAEGALFKAKDNWNKEFSTITKGLGTKSSNKIMMNALALEEDGIKLLGKKKVPLLNDKEKAAWEFMKNRYSALLEGVNDARAIVGKEPIKPRKNYITHIRDLGILDNMGFSAVTDDIENLLSNKVHRNSPAFKFAKRRTDSLADIEMDAFNVFNKYQEKALENVYMTPAIAKIRELSRTVIDDGAEKFKLQEVSPRLFKYVNEWTDYVAGQKIDNHLPKVVENTFKALNKNVAVSTLAFNLQSAVIQPAAIVNAVTELNPKNVSVGIKNLLAGKGKFALENSNILQGRQFETAIQDMATKTFGKFSRLKSKFGKAGTKPLQFLDSLTAQATWLGAYNKAVNVLKLEGKQAFNYADDIVVKTQASAAASDIAKVQRSTYGRLATQFQTFVINDFNRLGRDVLGVGNKKLSKSDVIKKAATYLVGISMWNYLSEDVLGLPSPFPRPIKDYKQGGIKEAAKGLATQIPVVGGAARYGSGILTGSVGDLIQSTTNKVSGKYTPTSWWEIVGKVIGVPGTVQLKKTLKSIKGLSDGYSVTYQKTLANGETVNKKAKIKITDSVDKIRALLFGMYNTMGAKEVRENKGKKSTNKPKLVMPPK